MIAAVTGGMQMTQSDILLLARTLAAARGVKLSTVSRWATRDTNPMLFGRLAVARLLAPHRQSRRGVV